MKMFKNVILLSLLVLPSLPMVSAIDPLTTMAAVSVIQLTLQEGRAAIGYLKPSEEDRLHEITVRERLKYAANEQRLNALVVEENLEYAVTKKHLRECLLAKKSKIMMDESNLPIGCEQAAREFIRCGGEREMMIMIDNINESYR